MSLKDKLVTVNYKDGVMLCPVCGEPMAEGVNHVECMTAFIEFMDKKELEEAVAALEDRINQLGGVRDA